MKKSKKQSEQTPMEFELEYNVTTKTMVIQTKLFELDIPGEHLKLILWIQRLASTSSRCFATQETLAWLMNKSVRQVQRYIDDLVKIGILKVKHNFTNEHRRSNNNYIMVDVETLESVFTMKQINDPNVKRQTVDSREKRKDQEEQEPYDTCVTTENTGFLANDPKILNENLNNDECDKIGSDTVITENMVTTPVQKSDSRHQCHIKYTVCSDLPALSEGQENGQEKLDEETKETFSEKETNLEKDTEDAIIRDLSAVLQRHGFNLKSEFTQDMLNAVILESSTPAELNQALTALFLYREKLAREGAKNGKAAKVDKPIGFVIMALREIIKHKDAFDSIPTPQEILDKLDGKKADPKPRPKNNKPIYKNSAGQPITKEQHEKQGKKKDKYKNFYL